jgi:glycosyltransferase involved in cell wall biosynthesis
MKVGILSFRLGMSDGISVAAGALARAFRDLGSTTVLIAGEGPVDRCVPGLSASFGAGPNRLALELALEDLDLVFVENLLTIPLHLPASRVVADVLRGRPAIVRHVDPPWQRARFAHITELPVDDPSWVHVSASRQTQRELLSQRGIGSNFVPPGLDLPSGLGDRARTRRRLGVGDDELLCIHPVRAIERKNIPAALALTEDLGGTYWLTGAAEEGYDAVAADLLANASVRTQWSSFDGISIDDAYAASDLVLFPSTVEGFGLPPIEAAFRRKLVVVGRYQVSEDLRAGGFAWPYQWEAPLIKELLGDHARLNAVLDQNWTTAVEQFSRAATTRRLRSLLDQFMGLSELSGSEQTAG